MVVNGIRMPDNEKHLSKFDEIVTNGTYQYERLRLAVDLCKKKRRCIDVGGHIGLWSMHLVKEFNKVEAFEPIYAHRECFIENVVGDYSLYPYALGDEEKEVHFVVDDENTGHTHIGDGKEFAEMKRLDDFNFEDVDLIKIDTEGYELFVCHGARETLIKNKPVICVEQKKHGYFVSDHLAAVKYLKELGYKVKHVIHGDYILA